MQIYVTAGTIVGPGTVVLNVLRLYISGACARGPCLHGFPRGMVLRSTRCPFLSSHGWRTKRHN